MIVTENLKQFVLDTFAREYGRPSEALFISPGRTELGGNHTDHNQGLVLAGAIQLAAVAAVAPRDDRIIRIQSAGFPPIEIDINHQVMPADHVEGKPEAFVYGIVAGFVSRNKQVGGFDALIKSSVPEGSGLSSSASFELLTASILNDLYNDGFLSPLALAIISREAERDYFGKPCGLMDQIACASGSITCIDFLKENVPAIETLSFDFETHGYRLAVVNTGGSHADLTAEYAAVAEEMHQIAHLLNAESLRELSEHKIIDNLAFLRRNTGDRALQRALHFFAENKRVETMCTALRQDDMEKYLNAVRESGRSSAMLLQNLYPSGVRHEQPLALALAMTERFLNGQGACRVHGGGFAGTIQAYIPDALFSTYKKMMEAVFDDDCVIPLRIIEHGAQQVKR